MKNSLRSFAVKTTLALATTLAFATAASATTLTTSLAVDDVYFAYLSTSATTQGEQIAFAADWSTVSTTSVELGSEAEYFLQIAAYDNGGSAGLLGSFSLEGTGYHFADGSTTVLSGSSLLTGNLTGFDGNYSAVNTIAASNTSQWDAVTGIDASAQWVWAGAYDYDNVSYFSLEILADTPVTSPSDVPEPASLGLLGLGLLALSRVRAKKSQ